MPVHRGLVTVNSFLCAITGYLHDTRDLSVVLFCMNVLSVEVTYDQCFESLLDSREYNCIVNSTLCIDL